VCKTPARRFFDARALQHNRSRRQPSRILGRTQLELCLIVDRMRERTLKLRKTEEQLAAELDAMTRLHKLALLSVSEDSLEPVLG